MLSTSSRGCLRNSQRKLRNTGARGPLGRWQTGATEAAADGAMGAQSAPRANVTGLCQVAGRGGRTPSGTTAVSQPGFTAGRCDPTSAC